MRGIIVIISIFTRKTDESERNKLNLQYKSIDNQMDSNFDYKEVPKNYTHCLNEQCVRSADCLRFKVAHYADKDIGSFLTVNPIYAANGEECRYFQPDLMTRFASGIKHLLDNLPHTKAVKIKDILYKHFGLNTFYRIQNKKRLIKPEEQDYIREVFLKEGIEEEPVFDEYVDKYDW